MKRELVFDGERGAKRFELLAAAMVAFNPDEKRPAATIRKEARIQDALDGLSDQHPTPQDPEARTLKATNGNGPLRLTLAQEDFELLQSYTEKVSWNPRISRHVVDLWDWMSAAEKVDG